MKSKTHLIAKQVGKLLLVSIMFFSLNCFGANGKPCLDSDDAWNEYLQPRYAALQPQIEALIRQFDINCRDKRGVTLLLALSGFASQYGGNETYVRDAIKYILANGADLSAKDRNGKYAWELQQSQEVRDYLLGTLSILKKHGTRDFNKASSAEAIRQNHLAAQDASRLANFRKNLKPGDDTTYGVVVEVKGNLVKIQTNESQCTQRDYQGTCTNYINTPAEKWFKRIEINPPN